MIGLNQLGDARSGFTLDPEAPGASLHTTTGLGYDASTTETPNVGGVEVWEIANLTADVHPMHFHLFDVQVLARAVHRVRVGR